MFTQTSEHEVTGSIRYTSHTFSRYPSFRVLHSPPVSIIIKILGSLYSSIHCFYNSAGTKLVNSFWWFFSQFVLLCNKNSLKCWMTTKSLLNLEGVNTDHKSSTQTKRTNHRMLLSFEADASALYLEDSSYIYSRKVVDLIRYSLSTDRILTTLIASSVLKQCNTAIEVVEIYKQKSHDCLIYLSMRAPTLGKKIDLAWKIVPKSCLTFSDRLSRNTVPPLSHPTQP